MNEASAAEPRTPFDKMGGSDGFHVIDVNAANYSALQLLIRQDGQAEFEFPVGPEVADLGNLRNSDGELWCRKNPTTKDNGERHRARIVMEAICRYFNTGGSWEELDSMVEAARGFIPGGIVFPGWHYYEGHHDREGEPIDVFAQEGTTQLVRWFQGSCFEPITQEALIREMEEDYDEGEETEAHRGGLRGPFGAEDSSEACGHAEATYLALPGPGSEG